MLTTRKLRRTPPGVPCPACGSIKTGVKVTTPAKGYIRRRRQCECGTRFTTKERSVEVPPTNERSVNVTG